MKKYIPLDALVAELEKRKSQNEEWKNSCKGIDALAASMVIQEDINILSFINTLEVKEVDLDFQMFAKEMDTVFNLPSSETKNTEEEPLNWEYAIAKHFFELGLKTKKGE